MKIKTEYQAMGMYVAWDDDDDADAENAPQGFGRSPEQAIKDLQEQLEEAE
jgi:hypothetical protein